jgi:uncharacterized membrane protein
MTTNPNLSPKFRHTLKGELRSWVEQGLMSDEASAQLTSIYKLDELGKESSRTLVAVIFTIGGLLLGGGVLSLVAANWEIIPTPLKVILLFAALIGFHLAGYWLRYQRDSPRLGHALIFCGCLVFGANIGLMAQIFNVSGEWHRGYAVWALGSLAMAWALRSWLIGLLALGLSFVWFAGFANELNESRAAAYPFLLSVFMLPLGWVTRARSLYLLTFLALIGALMMLSSIHTGLFGSSGYQILLAMVAGGFVSWAAGEYHRATVTLPELGNPVAVLGALTIAVCAYLGSFLGIWGDGAIDIQSLMRWWITPSVAAVIVGISLGIKAFGKMNNEQRIIFLGFSLACLMIGIGVLIGNRSGLLAAALANLAALMLAAIGIRKGILEERRSAFWLGTLFLALLVLSRFLEYETSLLLKSLAFIVCGAMTIAAGIAYERRLRQKEAAA